MPVRPVRLRHTIATVGRRECDADRWHPDRNASRPAWA